MVFKEFGKDVISLAKNYNTLNVMTKEQSIDVQQLVEDFNRLKNSGSLVGNMYQEQIRKVEALNNDNLTNVFQQVAEGAENARVNIVDAYTAILDGNTHGLQNVQSIFNTYNNTLKGNEENQKAFTKAVGQSNSSLAKYLTTVGTNGTATLKGYAGQLIATTAKTVGLQIATTALNAAISLGLSFAIAGLTKIISDAVVAQEELRESAEESAQEYKTQAESMKDLISQYDAIIDSEKTEAEKTQELNKWKQELVDTYKFEKDNLEELNLERERGIELLNNEIISSQRRDRNAYLDKYKNEIKESENILGGERFDTFASTAFFDGIDERITSLFERAEIGDIGGIFSFNADDAYDELNKLTEIYDEIADIQTRRDLTTSENELFGWVKSMMNQVNSEIEKYGTYYQTSSLYNAQNIFQDYFDNNKFTDEIELNGISAFNAWKQGLLSQAKNPEEKRQLQGIIEKQFPKFEDYSKDLKLAFDMFGIDDVVNDSTEGLQKAFLYALSPEDLEIATQIPDLFADGLEGATQKIEAWKKQNTPIETDVKINIDDALKTQSSKVDTIAKIAKEQAEQGYISSETYQKLIELGGNYTDSIETVNGKIKLNVDKLKDLETQEYKNTITANALTIAELEMSKARAIAAGADYSSIQALIDNLKNENALWSTLITEVYNADVDDGDSKGDSTEPESITKFKKALAKKEHLLNTNQISEQDYYEWLDDESKRVYGNLADYEEDLWKYEEQVYKWRQEQEQDLFDKKIENYKKLSDNALDKYIDGNGNELTVNASFDYARSQINSAIAETQNRINELSLKIGFEDEIEELTSDLEDLYDTLDDINKKEIESQKDYINELKDNYSDSMDEIIDKQKELADTIDKAYENQIDAIDKQIDAIEKKNEAEKRQNDILEARKKLEEAKREDAKNAYVSFNGTGFTIHQTTEAQDEAQADLDEAKQDEQIAKLEEQKEILETQRDNSKDYYDKVVEDLESQKEAREKQYDILVGIYEQLGGEKKQTSLNESLVNKLTKNGDINKAVQGLTPTEMKQAIASGILTTDSDGNYAIDYSILGKNEDAVNKNTAELEKLNSQLSGETNTDTSKVDMTKPHLDSEGYLVGTNGKRVLHDGKGIKATTKAEWEKKKTPYAGFETMTDLFTAIKSGSFNLPNSWSYANQTMNSNIMNSIGKDIKQVPEYVNNVTNSNAPNINFTVNVEGSADQKTVRVMEEKITAKLVEYTDAVTNTFKKKYNSI